MTWKPDCLGLVVLNAGFLPYSIIAIGELTWLSIFISYVLPLTNFIVARSVLYKRSDYWRCFRFSWILLLVWSVVHLGLLIFIKVVVLPDYVSVD